MKDYDETYDNKPNKAIAIIIGIIYIIIAFYVFSKPHITLLTLGVLLGISVLARGIGKIIFWNKLRKTLDENIVFILVLSILQIILGIYLLANTGISASVIALLIPIYFIISGITSIITANKFTTSKVRNIIITLNVLVIIAGVVMIWNPFSVAVALSVLMGIILLMKGIGIILEAF